MPTDPWSHGEPPEFQPPPPQNLRRPAPSLPPDWGGTSDSPPPDLSSPPYQPLPTRRKAQDGGLETLLMAAAAGAVLGGLAGVLYGMTGWEGGIQNATGERIATILAMWSVVGVILGAPLGALLAGIIRASR